MTTLVDTSSLDNILKEHLVAEVKKHLVKLIDSELESIARDAVVRFMDIEIAKTGDPADIRNTYYFSFVQKITRTVSQNIILKEKE